MPKVSLCENLGFKNVILTIPNRSTVVEHGHHGDVVGGFNLPWIGRATRTDVV